jgi:hypothetical protein
MAKEITVSIYGADGNLKRIDGSDEGLRKSIMVRQHGIEGRPLIYDIREERSKGIVVTTVTTTLPYVLAESIAHDGLVSI